MDALIGLVCIAICVLQVILFAKIWGMTNTTKVIQSKLEEIVEMMKHAEGKQVGIHSGTLTMEIWKRLQVIRI